MALEKLKIIPLTLQGSPKLGDAVLAMYNPAELTVETKVQYQRSNMPGMQVPLTQFVSGQAQTISFSLFFDTYEEKIDVRLLTSRVANLVKIHGDIHAPPICLFMWGGTSLPHPFQPFKGVIDSCSQKFTMFLSDGRPVRATLTLSVSEYQTLQEQVELIRFESSDRTKRRILKEGDTLQSLAYQEYGNPEFWRNIAEANNIVNPRLVPVGKEIVVPSLEKRHE